MSARSAAPPRSPTPTKRCAARGIAVAVVELRDGERTEYLAEAEEAAGALGDGHREERLARFAELGALGHVPQPIEPHVCARFDGDERLADDAPLRDIGLEPRDGESARRLGDRPVVLEHVLDGGADLVGARRDDLVDVKLRDAPRLLAHLPDGHSVGEDADAIERHALAGRERRLQASRVVGLDADDARARLQRLHVRGDARDETPAADGHEDGVDGAAVLTQDLHPDGPLPGDDLGVVVRSDERQAATGPELQRVGVRRVEVVAREHDLGAKRADCLDLDLGRRGGHDDGRPEPEPPSRERDALGVVARGRSDDPPGRVRRRERGDLVVGAADLEGEDAVQVLSLEEDAVAEALGEPGCGLERRLADDVVHARFEDALDVRVQGADHATFTRASAPSPGTRGA